MLTKLGMRSALLAWMFILGNTAPANAQSPHLAQTSTSRIGIDEDLYLKFKCVIASGKAGEDVDSILKSGDILKDIPFYNSAKVVIAATIKILALKKGTPYCFVAKWSAENGGRLVRTRLLMSQKQYAKGQQFKARLNRSCSTHVCLQLVKGADSVDTMTTCVERSRTSDKVARSVVVGVGNFASLVDANLVVMDKACSDRKF